MIYYETTCICCKRQFKLLEGTRKYQLYKVNRQRRLTCEQCDQKIHAEARKSLLSKLN